jgi:hypothetical protein
MRVLHLDRLPVECPEWADVQKLLALVLAQPSFSPSRLCSSIVRLQRRPHLSDVCLELSQVPMNGTKGYGALADGPGHTVDGAVPDVASRKDARQARFQRQRRTPQRPRLRWKVSPVRMNARPPTGGRREAILCEAPRRSTRSDWLDTGDSGFRSFGAAAWSGLSVGRIRSISRSGVRAHRIVQLADRLSSEVPTSSRKQSSPP